MSKQKRVTVEDMRGLYSEFEQLRQQREGLAFAEWERQIGELLTPLGERRIEAHAKERGISLAEARRELTPEPPESTKPLVYRPTMTEALIEQRMRAKSIDYTDAITQLSEEGYVHAEFQVENPRVMTDEEERAEWGFSNSDIEKRAKTLGCSYLEAMSVLQEEHAAKEAGRMFLEEERQRKETIRQLEEEGC